MIAAPIVMMAVFFVTITPIAFIVRWSGKDSLRLRRQSAVDTYWIKREGPKSTRETLKRHGAAPPVVQPTREQLLTALGQ